MSNERRQRPLARREIADAPAAREPDALDNELRALPDLNAPAGIWERVQERLDGEAARSRSQRRWGRQAPTAVAAGIAIVAAAAVLVSIHLPSGDVEPGGVTEVAANGLPHATEPLDRTAAIETLLEESRRAEQRRRAVLAFYSTSGPEQVLRAQIGGIDAALNEQMFAGAIEPKSREALLRDRVDLIADLTDIERYRQHEFVRQVSF